MVAKPAESIQQYDAGIKSAAAIDVSGGDVALARVTRGIYVGSNGNIVVQFCDDSTNTTLTGLAAGVWHPMQVQKIVQTGTTAGGIVAGY